MSAADQFNRRCEDKGGESLIFDNFRYRIDKQQPNGKRYWKCIVSGRGLGAMAPMEPWFTQLLAPWRQHRTLLTQVLRTFYGLNVLKTRGLSRSRRAAGKISTPPPPPLNFMSRRVAAAGDCVGAPPNFVKTLIFLRYPFRLQNVENTIWYPNRKPRLTSWCFVKCGPIIWGGWRR